MKLKKYFFKKVKSTNDTALRLINLGMQKGIILTEYQSKGRGQRNNKWISKKGNLFTSVFFDINKKISLKSIINLNILIIKKIISNKIKSSITIKKPNDCAIFIYILGQVICTLDWLAETLPFVTYLKRYFDAIAEAQSSMLM